MKSYIKAIGLALMICSRSLTYLLDFQRSSLYLMLLGFTLILFLSGKEIYNSKKIGLIFFVSICFIISLIASGMNTTTIEYCLYFICFGITSLLVPVIKDIKKVVRSILAIGIISIWSYTSIDYAEILENVGGINENVAGIFMDISYKTLVFVLSGVMLVVIDENRIIKIAAALTAAIYTIIAFVYGARGALLSIAVFLFCFWIIQAKNMQVRNKRAMTSVGILLLVVVLFMPIIGFIYEFLESQGIEARAVERIYHYMYSNESMSAGRDILYIKAANGIADSPIWGHGIGSFDNYSGVYPHNIILQLLYEGGLILAIPLLFLLVKGILLIFSFRHDQLYRNFLLLIFCAGVFELFLSSYLWMSICLWFFYGQTLLSEKYIRQQ